MRDPPGDHAARHGRGRADVAVWFQPHAVEIKVTKRAAAAAAPGARILILTAVEDDDYVFGALSAGASGFLPKRTQPEHLIAVIHTIAAGESLLSPSVTRTVISHVARQPRPDHSSQ